MDTQSEVKPVELTVEELDLIGGGYYTIAAFGVAFAEMVGGLLACVNSPKTPSIP